MHNFNIKMLFIYGLQIQFGFFSIALDIQTLILGVKIWHLQNPLLAECDPLSFESFPSEQIHGAYRVFGVKRCTRRDFMCEKVYLKKKKKSVAQSKNLNRNWDSSQIHKGQNQNMEIVITNTKS